MEALVHDLWSIALRAPESPPDPGAAHGLRLAEPEHWVAALQQLAPHRLSPLLAWQLERSELISAAPPSVQQGLGQALAEQRRTGPRNMLALGGLLAQAHQRQLPLLVIKGAVLADSLYPDPATRPMSDVDVVAAPEDADRLFALLEETGWKRVLDREQPEARYYESPLGTLCDAHCRFRLFEHYAREQVMQPYRFQRLHGAQCLTLTPDAALAHLAAHLHGHVLEVGPVLLWLVDIYLHTRAHAAHLDAQRVEQYLDPTPFDYLLRVLAMGQRYGVATPPSFEPAVRGVRPLSLPGLLRSRRTVPWQLSRPRGWLRLAAHKSGLRQDKHAAPSLGDLLLSPVDRLANRR